MGGTECDGAQAYANGSGPYWPDRGRSYDYREDRRGSRSPGGRDNIRVGRRQRPYGMQEDHRRLQKASAFEQATTFEMKWELETIGRFREEVPSTITSAQTSRSRRLAGPRSVLACAR